MPDNRTLIVLNTLMLIALTAGAVILYGKVQSLEQQISQNPLAKVIGGL